MNRYENLQLGAVRVTPTYELVLDQIRRVIFLGRFLPGDKLPAERELAVLFGVSRTSVREAIRVLEGQGLVEVKRGATGGIMVRNSDLIAANEIREYSDELRQTLDNVFDFRVANECAACALTAVRRTDEQLERLTALFNTMASLCATEEARAVTSNALQFIACDSEFHMTIAAASGNPYLVRAIEEARTAMYLPIGKIFVKLDADVNDHHDAIIDAITRRDAKAAYETMQVHIEHTRTNNHAYLAAQTSRKA